MFCHFPICCLESSVVFDCINPDFLYFFTLSNFQVITSLLCQHWNWRYRAMYKLDSPQCVSLASSACISDSTPEALLYLRDGEIVLNH